MKIEQMDVQIGGELGDQIEVTLRGKPDAIVAALAKGVGAENLRKIFGAVETELANHQPAGGTEAR